MKALGTKAWDRKDREEGEAADVEAADVTCKKAEASHIRPGVWALAGVTVPPSVDQSVLVHATDNSRIQL